MTVVLDFTLALPSSRFSDLYLYLQSTYSFTLTGYEPGSRYSLKSPIFFFSLSFFP